MNRMGWPGIIAGVALASAAVSGVGTYALTRSDGTPQSDVVVGVLLKCATVLGSGIPTDMNGDACKPHVTLNNRSSAPVHSSDPMNVVPDERKLVFQTARSFASSAPENVPWLVPGYFARGAITEVAGKVKRGGKTTLMLAASKAVIQGVPFLGTNTTAATVVYLTEQTGPSFRQALERAELTDCEDFHFVPWNQTVGMAWDDVAGQAAAFAVSVSAGLLVVDTLGQFARIAGDAENSAGDALAAMRPLQEAAAAGLSVAVVRHERKSGGDVGDSGRGSSAFAGAVDIVLAVRRPEGATAENVRVIHGLSRFDETPSELAIELGADGQYRVLGDAKDLAARQTRAYLLAALPRDESAAVGIDTLARQDGAPPRSAIAGVLKELAASETALRKGGGVKGSPFVYWLAGTEDSFVCDSTLGADE